MLRRTTPRPPPQGSEIMRTTPLVLLALLGAVLVGAGCSSTQDTSGCHVGADCVSGACGIDGKCLPTTKTDAGTDTALTDTGMVGEDSTPSDVAPEVIGCAPNHDGKIEAKEVPLAAGLEATFRFAKN